MWLVEINKKNFQIYIFEIIQHLGLSQHLTAPPAINGDANNQALKLVYVHLQWQVKIVIGNIDIMEYLPDMAW